MKTEKIFTNQEINVDMKKSEDYYAENNELLKEIVSLLKKIEENTNPNSVWKKIKTPLPTKFEVKDPLCTCPNGPYWSVIPPYCPVHNSTSAQNTKTSDRTNGEE